MAVASRRVFQCWQGALLCAPAVGLGSGRLQPLCDCRNQGCCRLIQLPRLTGSTSFLHAGVCCSEVLGGSFSIMAFRGSVRPQALLGESPDEYLSADNFTSSVLG